MSAITILSLKGIIDQPNKLKVKVIKGDKMNII